MRIPLFLLSSTALIGFCAGQSGTEFSYNVKVDAAKEGHPISEYIYGQFIEHLGRCINGGIWAEVLEDRKFYYPVGSEDSPWKPVGAAESVEMSSENAYVGEHSPRILLVSEKSPAGLSQGDLGLRSGIGYTGRIVLWKDGSVDSVTVTLAWGDGPTDRQACTLTPVPDQPVTLPLQFFSRKETHTGCLEIASTGDGSVFVGCVSLMPSDNVNGLRADTLALLKELNSSVYRWPGGNFVSGYDWKDGIGDPDKRPTRKNPAWKGIEPNDFGIDEFLAFCRELDTEPYIAVNSGLGDEESAAEQVEYVNGSPGSAMGSLRAKNGHPEPYAVKWWGIGNEMYGDWQLGHMPLDDYTKKHNRFAEAMRDADPTIQLIGVGAVGEWSERMLEQCSDHMEYLSEHFYKGEGKDLLGHIRQIPDAVRHIADSHRKYRQEIEGLAEKDIQIAVDEWNYWYGPEIYGQIGTRYFLKDALGVAMGIHEFARNSDILFMANYAQTVNVIGCIKTSKTAASFATTGLVLKLYRNHLGAIPVEVSGDTGDLDVLAAWTEDRKQLTLAAVNPTKESVQLNCDFQDFDCPSSATKMEITGPDELSYNNPGEEPNVTLVEREVSVEEKSLSLSPLSVSLFKF